jgi:hypothetical protein
MRFETRRRPEAQIPILAGVAEAIEGGPDLVWENLVAGRKLIPEEWRHPGYPKVDLVGAVGVGGMNLRLDVSGIVEQWIKDVVTLMPVG